MTLAQADAARLPWHPDMPLEYRNQIVTGDARELAKRIPDESIDLILTSPPYDDLRDYDGYCFNFEAIAQELARIIRKGGVIVWVVADQTIGGSETGTSFQHALFFKDVLKLNLHDTMIYQTSKPPQNSNRYEPEFEYMFIFSKGAPKTFNPLMRKRRYFDNRKIKTIQRNRDGTFSQGQPKKSDWVRRGNVWIINSGGGLTTKDKIAYLHPAIFPEELARDHIKSWSNPGELVLDPMCGSGTTCKMAKQWERNWIGFEISEKYAAIARKRITETQPPLGLDGLE